MKQEQARRLAEEVEAIATALVKFTDGQEPVACRYQTQNGDTLRMSDWQFGSVERAILLQEDNKRREGSIFGPKYVIEPLYTHPALSQQEVTEKLQNSS